MDKGLILSCIIFLNVKNVNSMDVNYTLPTPLAIDDNANEVLPTVTQWPGPSESVDAKFEHAAVASDHGIASAIGRDILLAGGNAVDAMIASLLAIGVVNPQSSGIGGSTLMTIYKAAEKRCYSIDARGTAPLSSNSTMFVDNPQDSTLGWRASVVPGEIHGFWTAFKKFGSGKVSWKNIFLPSIELARNGFPISESLAMVLKQKEEEIMTDDEMMKTFTNPKTGNLYEEGEILKRETLAATLEAIANATDPIELFYRSGSLAKTIAAEFEANDGELTLEDLASFESIVYETSIESHALPGNLCMCGPPPPSSFPITQAIVGIMSEFYSTSQDSINFDDPEVYHRLIEAEKFAYSYRNKLADPAFANNSFEISQYITQPGFIQEIASRILKKAQPLAYYNPDLTAAPEDHGTSHVSVLDSEGNAVSATTTVNLLLGSKRMSPSLGIIWNNLMDDFSTPGQPNAFGFPPSPVNYIEPGKRPLSAMTPTIIYNKNNGKVKMVVGGSGGSRIISAVAQTIIRSILFNQTIKEAVDAPRFHNQFLPNITEYEATTPVKIIEALGSQFEQIITPVAIQESVVQALSIENDGLIHGNSDFRRKTSAKPAGY